MKTILMLLDSEILVLGGIALLAAAVLIWLTAIVLYVITGRKLQKNLEEEYGKRHR